MSITPHFPTFKHLREEKNADYADSNPWDWNSLSKGRGPARNSSTSL